VTRVELNMSAESRHDLLRRFELSQSIEHSKTGCRQEAMRRTNDEESPHGSDQRHFLRLPDVQLANER
jgi:hypothetical protein